MTPLICRRCGWEWLPRTLGEPKRCANPKCRSPYWKASPVVYVMKGWGEEGHYKIGCTDNITSRYNSIRGRNSIIYTIACGQENMYNVESAMHDLFGQRRVAGEIFALTNEDLQLLEEIKASNDPLALIKEKTPSGPNGKYQCADCEYTWVPRGKGKVPKECPNCKSRAWNK